jgi:hypothetical protein
MANLCYKQTQDLTAVMVIFHNKNFLHWTFRRFAVGVLLGAESHSGYAGSCDCPLLITWNRPASLTSQFLLRKMYFSGILLQFFLNLGIDIADSDTKGVKLPVDEELKDSRPAINDFDCGVFLFLEAC